ncbi:uncharacterized protein LOC143884096 isoform X2 [Tasmannia lanceolata]|uniref:uncharacterized protein LOC143884096 isoform X2 n=1 Tax=Tasmannia lanceolata TaxID=3420 RepID=UPI0040639EAB
MVAPQSGQSVSIEFPCNETHISVVYVQRNAHLTDGKKGGINSRENPSGSPPRNIRSRYKPSDETHRLRHHLRRALSSGEAKKGGNRAWICMFQLLFYIDAGLNHSRLNLTSTKYPAYFLPLSGQVNRALEKTTKGFLMIIQKQMLQQVLL